MKAKNSNPTSIPEKRGDPSHSIQREREKLDQAMSLVLEKNSRQTLSLWVFVAAGLKRYNLKEMYDAKFVLNESYIRSVRAVERGTVITSHIAWFRQTSRHIIQELSRQRQRHQKQSNAPDDIPEEVIEDAEGEAHRFLEHQRMQAAFNQLELLDKRILSMKVVNGYKWNRIREILSEEGYGDVKEPALRQRKTRALKKLREYYQSIDL